VDREPETCAERLLWRDDAGARVADRGLHGVGEVWETGTQLALGLAMAAGLAASREPRRRRRPAVVDA